MDGDTLLAEITEDQKTELSRLGSSKSLYADTEGEMEPAAVLAALADSTHHAAAVLAEWAEESEDGTFDDAATREQETSETILAETDGHDHGPRPPVVNAMAGADGTPARLGALVGYTLVAERKASQATGFFTGQAKPQVASTFRSFGDEYDQTRAAALDALEESSTDEDWDDAAAAGIAVVQAAYDDYVETLESLGVNPKPVC